MNLTPYPLIYCPKGINKPACCPHVAIMELFAGKGPDAVTTLVNGQEITEGGGGRCYGGGYQVGSPGWTKTKAGWWVQLRGHRPQDLIRLQPHPRVRRWVQIPGAQTDHLWQVPVLIEEGGTGWTSSLDGVWDGDEFHGGELADLQTQLLAVVRGVAHDHDASDLQKAIRELAVSILCVGQWVDEDLVIAGKFLSESVMLGAITAACGRSPE